MTCTVHVEPMVDPTVGAPAGVRRAWHLAAMLALLATGLWVLGIVAGRAAWRIGLVAAMASCVVPLLAVPLARRVFAVPFPPGSVLLQDAGMVLAAIAGLTLWRHLRLAGRQEPETGVHCEAEFTDVTFEAVVAQAGIVSGARPARRVRSRTKAC